MSASQVESKVRRRLFSLLLPFIVITFAATTLLLSLRGYLGNPTAANLSLKLWKEDGPFELSPERGRFALTYSLVENRSFYLSLPLAAFSTPDLGYKNGHYVSLFAPGVSFLAIPGYLLGKFFGASQVGAFSTISLFGLLNLILIWKIARKLGAGSLAAALAAIAYLFATPAFSYSVTLYEHQPSVFLLLSAIYTLLRFDGLLPLAVVWFLYGVSFSIDYPNSILIFPVGLFALKRLIVLRTVGTKLTISLKTAGFLTFLAVLFPIAFFLWTNQQSYGNPFQLAGTVKAISSINETNQQSARGLNEGQLEKRFDAEPQNKTAVGFFQSRDLLNGFYIHFLSPDRGLIFYAPLTLLAFFGVPVLYKKNKGALMMLLGVIGVNILLYSLWGDPWGGWAFGSRYLIPSYAIASVLIALALTKFRKSIVFFALFLGLFTFSVFVNTAGALSTSADPPQIQVLSLEKLSGFQQKYTVERNLDILRSGNSKSFIFQAFAYKYLSAWGYFEIVAGAIIVVGFILLLALRFTPAERIND